MEGILVENSSKIVQFEIIRYKLIGIVIQSNDINNTMTDKIKPIQLISFDSNKKIVVNQEAVNWLMNANQSKHIGIVTVVGKYRTGKSYILNRVLLNQNSGFQVGPTINACTKGLWVWPELISNPNDPTVQYMVMDTEGLGSLEEGEQTDTKIFLMAMLLSSYFIYNSVGSIDEKAVQNLSLIINLSKLLQKGNQKEMKDIINCFPSFMWLVRDFALRLEDNHGKPISPQQYLESALRLQDGVSEATVRKNCVRKELINFFKDRECFILIRPVDDEKKLQNMASVKDSQLRPKFLELITQLRSKLLCGIKKKMFKGKPCSPAMFVELCQYFCNSINQGGLPDIENNWDLVCRAESNRIQKRCLDDFKKFLKVYQTKKANEIDMKKFENEANELIVKIIKYFQKNALGQKLEKKKMMKEAMIEEYEKLKKKISTIKNESLNELLNNVNDQIHSMISKSGINSLFQVADKYDEIIETESKGASEQTSCYIYKKCYEGLKMNSFTLFANILQNHKYETGLLQEKLGYYHNQFNKIQQGESKKYQESDVKVRQLNQFVYQQELKLKEAQEKLQRAERELTQYKQAKQNINYVK